jgi:formylmethanofuran dehydrogenase subunit A
MKTPQWYKQKIKEVKKKKRELTSAEIGTYFNGVTLTNKKMKEMKEDLKKEKRSYKRAEKQDLKKSIDEEILNWKRK